MNDDKLLHKWIEGTISPEELKIFQLRPDYESLSELYKNTEHLSAPEFDQEAMLRRVKSSKTTSGPKRQPAKVIGLPNWAKLSIAASLLALVAFFFLQNDGVVTHRMAQAEVYKGTLPDGSTFVLNAESDLSYNEKKWEAERLIQLDGEAYFEVMPGTNFRAQTPNGAVQVLGTHFNVWSRDQLLEVSCQEGKVAIINTMGQELTQLAANDAVRVADNQIATQWQQAPAAEASWLKGIFQLRKVPLSRVLDELERQFSVQFKTVDLPLSDIVSCNFRRDDLEAALKTTLTPMGIKYTIDDENIVSLYK